MKTKTIRKILRAKFDKWTASIDDPALRIQVGQNSIITGGAIASMLLREPVNDFDVYFRNAETALAVAKYYVSKFRNTVKDGIKCNIYAEQDKETQRIRIIVKSDGVASEEEVDMEIEDKYQETEQSALNTEDEDGKPPFRPVFLSTNAITLSNKLQIVLRFHGEPDQIHENYDFVHCTNYWTSWDDQLVLRPEALEALLTKELRYVGSKYPVCSVIRLRKFIARQWTVNAGQILKMLMQINDLDLTDPAVLQDQLTGVDSAYFFQLMTKLKEKDPEKVNTAYLIEIIDRLF